MGSGEGLQETVSIMGVCGRDKTLLVHCGIPGAAKHERSRRKWDKQSKRVANSRGGKAKCLH